MPKSGVEIPPEYFFPENEIDGQNKTWLGEFKTSKKKPYADGYISKLSKFLRFRDFANIPFNAFKYEDVSIYLAILQKYNYPPEYCDTIVSAVTGFKYFLSKTYPQIFAENFLSNLITLRSRDDSKEKDFIPERLDLRQLKGIRDYNKIHGLQDEYIFEIYFQLGIDKMDFKVCSPQNRDKEHARFVWEDDVIFYNDKINELLEKLGETDLWEWNIHTIDAYLDKITDLLRNNYGYSKLRPFRYSDIIASHNLYILKCPICHRPFENIKENWVLASSDENENYEFHLVCKVCKGCPNGT